MNGHLVLALVFLVCQQLSKVEAIKCYECRSEVDFVCNRGECGGDDAPRCWKTLALDITTGEKSVGKGCTNVRDPGGGIGGPLGCNTESPNPDEYRYFQCTCDYDWCNGDDRMPPGTGVFATPGVEYNNATKYVFSKAELERPKNETLGHLKSVPFATTTSRISSLRLTNISTTVVTEARDSLETKLAWATKQLNSVDVGVNESIQYVQLIGECADALAKLYRLDGTPLN